ncbi:hypothetical protein [uncultured Nocardioides sp.]|uniref:hypothetical protein n=1 Tax=uncultured Nocardioides sp. TaxID=198441 RepID=UPI00262D192D|nr:hypothetical protein [uncultured Nocardioides sp.]HRD59366.1 hypothetical protein [Nocardioides sp.]
MSECPTPRKIRHKTHAAAVSQIMSIKAREGRNDNTLKPYRCGDHWHIGHTPGTGNGGLKGKIRRALREAR